MLPSGAMQGRKAKPFVGILTGFLCLLKGFKVAKVHQFLIDLNARKPLSLAAVIAYPNRTARVVGWQFSVHRILLITYLAQVFRAIVHLVLIDVVNIAVRPSPARKSKRNSVRLKQGPLYPAAKIATRMNRAKRRLIGVLCVPSLVRYVGAEKVAAAMPPSKSAAFRVKSHQSPQPV